MSRILFHNVRIVDCQTDIPNGWMLTEDDRIAEIGNGDWSFPADSDMQIIDGKNKILMPGVIDEHVHFREPGLTHKADIASESAAAAAGGVTTFFDMPNTVPPTISQKAWEEKMDIASENSIINYAFYIGVNPNNIEFIKEADYTLIPGIKLFMGSTTGSTASDSNDFLNELFRSASVPVAVHAEDEGVITKCRTNIVAKYSDNPPIWMHKDIRPVEACVAATKRITSLARSYGKRLHLMHVSTAEELKFLDKGPVADKLITSETCPQYLFFDSRDYEKRGAQIKCNPSIKDAYDRGQLAVAVEKGLIDCIATDHAPHLLPDKEGGALQAASGMPGVQFSLPLMITFAELKGVSLPDISRMMSANPAEIWGVDRRGLLKKGYHADLVLVEKSKYQIYDENVLSRCGWTPYAGMEVSYKVDSTWVNGRRVYDRTNGVDNDSHAGRAVKFRTHASK